MNPQRRLQLFLGLTIAVCLASLATVTEATHGRYMAFSWRHVQGYEVEFTVTGGWRRSFFGAPTVGGHLGSMRVFYEAGYEDNPLTTITFVNEDEDWIIDESVSRYTYDDSGPWIFSMGVCCRIHDLVNNAGSDPFGEGIVDLRPDSNGNINNSPVTSLSPVIDVIEGRENTFFVPAQDPDGDTLKFSLAENWDGDHPSGLSIDEHRGNVTFIPEHGPGSLYSTQITISDGSAVIFVDFMMRVVQEHLSCQGCQDLEDDTCGSACSTDGDCAGGCTCQVNEGPSFLEGSPWVDNPGGCLGFPVGVETCHTFFVGSDNNGCQTVTLSAVGQPAGSSLGIANHTEGETHGTPFALCWEPTPEQTGSRIVTFQGVDEHGVQGEAASVCVAGGEGTAPIPPGGSLPCCTRDPNDFLVDCENCPEHTIFAGLGFTQGFLPGAFNNPSARNITTLEVRGGDFKKLKNGALRGLDFLETLRISDSSLSEIEPNVFSSAQQDFRSLSEFDPDTPNLKNVLLARNQLTELPENLLWGINVDRLDVRGNQIKLLPLKLFKGQDTITLADFRNNDIEFMIRTEEPLKETLYEGTKFFDFFVDGNPGHDECPEGTVFPFKEFGMEDFETIMDGFCAIPRCEDSARFCFATHRPEPTCCLVETDSTSGKHTVKYCKCSEKETIDLSCHGIEEIANGAFDHDENHNVTQINLSSNSMSRVKTSTLSGLPNIHTIIIRNNTISAIDDKSFRDLPTLRHLHLDSNKLTEIDHLTLRGLFNLTTLTATHNNIERVGIHSFSETTKIESIYLSNNKLDVLPLHGLKTLFSLLEVELMGNPGYQSCTQNGEVYG